MNVTAAFPVVEASQVAGPRRTVLWLADQIGFTPERAGQAALIVSELATNLVKHGRGGEILLRPLTLPTGEREGVEIVALDAGPGMSDPGRSRVDGVSTAGTLGHGLGAVERQSDSMDFYTDPRGTVIVSSIWRVPRLPRATAGRYEVGAVQVSKAEEDVCGDGWAWRQRDGRLAILVADGLGHGLHAHDAAQAALEIFATAHEQDPARVVTDVHAALRSTRGAAVAMLAVDIERGTARYSGLGNIASTILSPTGAHRLVSHNGTAGHTAARIQEFQYPVPAGSLLVLASDGLGTHWDLAAYPGLRTRSASLIAAVLYREFSRRRDDVTVVIAKERPSVAEKL